MFKLKNFKNGAEKYVQLGQKTLEIVQRELNLFENLNLEFTGTIMPSSRNHHYEMKSEALPNKALGLMAYAVREMTMSVLGNIYEEENKAEFWLEFNYIIRDGVGGRASINISDFGGSEFRIRFDMLSNDFTIVRKNVRASNVVRNLEITFDCWKGDTELKENILNLIQEIRPYFKKSNLTNLELLDFISLLTKLKTQIQFNDNGELRVEINEDVLKDLKELEDVIKDFNYLLKNKK